MTARHTKVRPIAVVYARSATSTQPDSHQALQIQLQTCRQYALDKDYRIVVEYTDVASGLTLDRPGLNHLRDDLTRINADVLIVTDPARLSRRFLHASLIEHQLRKRGVTITFINHRVRRGAAV